MTQTADQSYHICDTAVAASESIIANAVAHHDKPPSLRVLVQEMGELAEALNGDHEHSPEHELAQIGGIVLHWLINLHYPCDSNWAETEENRT